LVFNNKITIDEWEKFFSELYQGTSDDFESIPAIREDIPLLQEDIEKELGSLKNRKSPGPDGIFNEMLKYGGTELSLHLMQLFQQIFKQHTFPKAWKQSIITPLFKKGSKTNPESFVLLVN